MRQAKVEVGVRFRLLRLTGFRSMLPHLPLSFLPFCNINDHCISIASCRGMDMGTHHRHHPALQLRRHTSLLSRMSQSPIYPPTPVRATRNLFARSLAIRRRLPSLLPRIKIILLHLQVEDRRRTVILRACCALYHCPTTPPQPGVSVKLHPASFLLGTTCESDS